MWKKALKIILLVLIIVFFVQLNWSFYQEKNIPFSNDITFNGMPITEVQTTK